MSVDIVSVTVRFQARVDHGVNCNVAAAFFLVRKLHSFRLHS